jgi:Uma2 family endonuclease
MHMALETRPWTRADLDRLPDDGNRYEVLDGELLVTPAPSAPHQQIAAWLTGKLVPFVMAHRIGRVEHPRSVLVVDGSQLEPDMMVRPAAPFERWEDAPLPMLVVEVLSNATRRRDLYQKRAFYMATGIPEYWVIDRNERALIRITAVGAETVRSMLTWAPTGIAATLEIDVAAMFREVYPAG